MIYLVSLRAMPDRSRCGTARLYDGRHIVFCIVHLASMFSRRHSVSFLCGSTDQAVQRGWHNGSAHEKRGIVCLSLCQLSSQIVDVVLYSGVQHTLFRYGARLTYVYGLLVLEVILLLSTCSKFLCAQYQLHAATVSTIGIRIGILVRKNISALVKHRGIIHLYVYIKVFELTNCQAAYHMRVPHPTIDYISPLGFFEFPKPIRCIDNQIEFF